jgi:penicillin-binding protein 1A
MKRFIFRSFAMVFVIVFGIAAGGYLALLKGVPEIEEIKDYLPSNGTRVYADDDTFIGEFKVEKGEHVPISEIPEHVIKAIISIEDARFWLHRGLDYVAIIRAVSRDIIAGRIKEGGSTITQQLAKVVFLSPERTIVRKLKEAILASRLEQNLTKEEILELYLNKVYFGHGAYGIEMASRAYFGKTISEVNLAEASLLCGLVKAPNRYSPYRDLQKAKNRQRLVLNRMRSEGYITLEQVDDAYKHPLYLTSLRYADKTQNYFLEYIRKYLEDEYGVERVYKGGLKVYTTLNREIQGNAVKALKEGLRRLDKRQGFRGPLGHRDIDVKEEMGKAEKFKKVLMKPGDLLTATVLKVSATRATVKTRDILGRLNMSGAKWAKTIIDSKGNVIKRFNILKLTDILKPGDTIIVRVEDTGGKDPVFTLEQEPLVQGAVVAIEPSTGYIRAIVGGYDFSKSEFNRAVTAKRQAGSAFKPLIFAAAMDYGYTPASVIVDEPLVYPDKELGEWEPENYDEKYHGPTRLREALAYSRNLVTVKLLEEVGVKNTIKFARKLGIKGPFPYNLTLALGSLSVSPLEMTSAFCVFASEGIRMTPIGVKYIMDQEGNIIENNELRGTRVISSQTAFLATSMLEEVVNHGTGWRARALKRPVAGKTGTTNEYRDAWFIGFTDELAAGVWVGFDNMRTLGDEETGSRAAAPIWVSFMKDALSVASPYSEKAEIKPFRIPDGIVTAVIDPLTGLLATNETKKMVEFFREGTVPKEYSTESYREMVRSRKEELRRYKKPDPDEG